MCVKPTRECAFDPRWRRAATSAASRLQAIRKQNKKLFGTTASAEAEGWILGRPDRFKAEQTMETLTDLTSRHLFSGRIVQ